MYECMVFTSSLLGFHAREDSYLKISCMVPSRTTFSTSAFDFVSSMDGWPGTG
jgi:hypothetical protein